VLESRIPFLAEFARRDTIKRSFKLANVTFNVFSNEFDHIVITKSPFAAFDRRIAILVSRSGFQYRDIPPSNGIQFFYGGNGLGRPITRSLFVYLSAKGVENVEKFILAFSFPVVERRYYITDFCSDF
jgi:hypothetical protein